VVKNQAGDKLSTGILFERNGDMEAELAEISADIKGRWNVDDVLLVRRIGTLKIGDVISLIAVSSPASNDAFKACRFGLERLKKMVSLRKTEMLQVHGKNLQ
jgi:molybdopterin synthase catalytic subunit